MSPQGPRKTYADALSVFWQLGMILMLAVYSICFVTLVYSFLILGLPALQAEQLTYWRMLTIFPQLAVLFEINGAFAVTVYFILIFVSLVLIHYWFFLSDGKSFVQLFSAPLSSLVPRLRSKNRWVMVAQLFLAVQFFQLVYTRLLEAAGVPITGPEGMPTDTWWLLLGLAEASVYEEVVSRVALIGAPMFLVSIVIRIMRLRRTRAPEPWNAKEQRYYVLGSFRYLWGGTVNRKSSGPVFASSFILAVASSIFFSAAHSNYGDWKLLPTFIAGLALAYAYLRGGLLASILLHFSVNMFSGSAVLVQNNLPILVIIALLIWAVIAMGSGFFVYYCVYFVNILRERLGRPSPAGSEVPQVPASPFVPPFASVCPHCRWPESVYVDGVLRCVNCGRER